MDRLAKVKVTLELAMRYMDDGRAFLFPIKSGWRWCMGDLVFCKRWEQEDREISPTERTKRILHGTMMDIEDFLKFTVETGEDFVSGWLATLDTDIRVTEKNVVEYKYYEKPMSSNDCVQRMSAMEENAKMKTLANDLTRRLLNTCELMGDGVRVGIVDDYSKKLLTSGYRLDQVRKII